MKAWSCTAKVLFWIPTSSKKRKGNTSKYISPKRIKECTSTYLNPPHPQTAFRYTILQYKSNSLIIESAKYVRYFDWLRVKPVFFTTAYWLENPTHLPHNAYAIPLVQLWFPQYFSLFCVLYSSCAWHKSTFVCLRRSSHRGNAYKKGQKEPYSPLKRRSCDQ